MGCLELLRSDFTQVLGGKAEEAVGAGYFGIDLHAVLDIFKFIHRRQLYQL